MLLGEYLFLLLIGSPVIYSVPLIHGKRNCISCFQSFEMFLLKSLRQAHESESKHLCSFMKIFGSQKRKFKIANNSKNTRKKYAHLQSTLAIIAMASFNCYLKVTLRSDLVFVARSNESVVVIEKFGQRFLLQYTGQLQLIGIQKQCQFCDF